jgi:glycosyltransferase involved in cell wall biosynthesis
VSTNTQFPLLKISVVTPTLRRPGEVGDLLNNLSQQRLLPYEVILVDGAPDGEDDTKTIATRAFKQMPFAGQYLRHGGGTAIQRNVGIEQARGDLIALIDDDIRLEPNFLEVMADVYARDRKRDIGGVVGYRTNEHFAIHSRMRWRWYRRLWLLTTYEPGRYDYETGYPINANLQPPFQGTREVDFMTTACAVWRREVFGNGLSFDPFFRGYGMLEDAHFALRAKKKWRLLQCGDAKCQHLGSPNGRPDRKKIGYMCVVNYYYVFRDVAGPLTFGKRVRFWRYQAFEWFRMLASALRRGKKSDFQELVGRLGGVVAILSGRAWKEKTESGK